VVRFGYTLEKQMWWTSPVKRAELKRTRHSVLMVILWSAAVISSLCLQTLVS